MSEANLKHFLSFNKAKKKVNIRAYVKQFFFCWVMVLSIFSNTIAQNYHQKLDNGTNEEKLIATWELFKQYRTTNADSALHYAQLNNQFALGLRDTLSIIKSYNAVGYMFQVKTDYKKSIINYKRGLELAEIKSVTKQMRYLLNNLALVYTYSGVYDLSLEYHFKSLKLREKDNDIPGIIVALNNIGIVYYEVGDFEKALIYLKKAKRLREENDLPVNSNDLINMGLVYIGLEDYQSAKNTFTIILDNCSEDCDTQTLLKIYTGLGGANFELGHYEEAKKNYQQAIVQSNKIGEKLYLIASYYYLAKINYELGSYEKALEILINTSSVTESTDSQKWKMNIDDLLADIYDKLGDYEKAYHYKNRYSNLKDSIFSEDLIKNLANIQLDYQEEQSQEIIAGKDFQIQRRNQINLLLGGITLLITALLIILYKNIQLKKKANRQLADANDIIEHQNKELTDMNAVLEERVKERTKELKKSNVALQQSNEELDNFIYKTSHDIRGPLATLMGVCNIAQIDVKDQQALDYFEKLSITAFRLNEILSKLLTINQINNAALQPEEIELPTLINELLAEHLGNYKNPGVKVSIDIEEKMLLNCDMALIRVIYGNLINNAIKFRDTSQRRESQIKIMITPSERWVIFRIEDNGIGINKSESEKIFEVFSKATDIADSSGIGLYLVKLAIEKLKGRIKHGRNEDEETFFEVKLPS